MSEFQENLKRFKITYSQYYIQVLPPQTRSLLFSHPSRRRCSSTNAAIRYTSKVTPPHHIDVNKQYEFSNEYTVKFASLILGLAEIEGDYFLLYVENVYLQPPFPPTHIGVYQIATINYLQYSRVVTNRAL